VNERNSKLRNLLTIEGFKIDFKYVFKIIIGVKIKSSVFSFYVGTRIVVLFLQKMVEWTQITNYSYSMMWTVEY